VYADVPARIVVDAGPLIGLLNRRDPYHSDALRGFERLTSHDARIVVPLPIVLEVFKWLIHRTTLETARTALVWMSEDVEIVYSGSVELREMLALMAGRPNWRGTLEDASVVQAATRSAAPVWTIDYGDLSAFPNLQFWTPG